MKNKVTLSAVDLFCGVGGLTHGLLQAGIPVNSGYDIDETCKYAYEINNSATFFAKDIAQLTGAELMEQFRNSKVRILVGCAPCQPFSNYVKKGKLNKKWILLYEFGRLIEETQPDIVSMENVAQLLDFHKAPIFQDFMETLESNGYHCHFEIVNCADYGIPQARKRLIVLASKHGPIGLKPPTHTPDNYVTVRQAIGHLPPIQHGETHSRDPLHKATRINALNLKRIQSTREGGSWTDWDDHLLLNCHKKKSGKSYTSSYGRMWWDRPSPTITTHCNGYGNGRFGHPEQDRAISLREAALLQSFPENYRFFVAGHTPVVRKLAMQLGNAVPVGIGRIIGESISSHIEHHFTSLT